MKIFSFLGRQSCVKVVSGFKKIIAFFLIVSIIPAFSMFFCRANATAAFGKYFTISCVEKNPDDSSWSWKEIASDLNKPKLGETVFFELSFDSTALVPAEDLRYSHTATLVISSVGISALTLSDSKCEFSDSSIKKLNYSVGYPETGGSKWYVPESEMCVDIVGVKNGSLIISGKITDVDLPTLSVKLLYGNCVLPVISNEDYNIGYYDFTPAASFYAEGNKTVTVVSNETITNLVGYRIDTPRTDANGQNSFVLLIDRQTHELKKITLLFRGKTYIAEKNGKEVIFVPMQTFLDGDVVEISQADAKTDSEIIYPLLKYYEAMLKYFGIIGENDIISNEMLYTHSADYGYSEVSFVYGSPETPILPFETEFIPLPKTPSPTFTHSPMPQNTPLGSDEVFIFRTDDPIISGKKDNTFVMTILFLILGLLIILFVFYEIVKSNQKKFRSDIEKIGKDEKTKM